jgi:hydrogenase maturation factor HypF (carbamoyltransferase family)
MSIYYLIYIGLKNKNFIPFAHRISPSNDGCISLGQIMVANHMKKGDDYGNKQF